MRNSLEKRKYFRLHMEVLSFLYARHEHCLRGESPKVIRNGRWSFLELAKK